VCLSLPLWISKVYNTHTLYTLSIYLSLSVYSTHFSFLCSLYIVFSLLSLYIYIVSVSSPVCVSLFPCGSQRYIIHTLSTLSLSIYLSLSVYSTHFSFLCSLYIVFSLLSMYIYCLCLFPCVTHTHTLTHSLIHTHTHTHTHTHPQLKGTIISCSHTVEPIFGYTVQELLGKNVSILADPPTAVYNTHTHYIYITLNNTHIHTHLHTHTLSIYLYHLITHAHSLSIYIYIYHLITHLHTHIHTYNTVI